MSDTVVVRGVPPLLSERDLDPSLIRHIISLAVSRRINELSNGKTEISEKSLSQIPPDSYWEIARILTERKGASKELANWALKTALKIAEGLSLYDPALGQLYPGFDILFKTARAWFHTDTIAKKIIIAA